MEERELPTGWIIIQLNEIADVGAGNPAPQGKDKFSLNGVPFVRVQDMGKLAGKKFLLNPNDRVNENCVTNLRLFPKGTVLLTKSGASTLLNQRAILGEDSYVVSHIATVGAGATTSEDWLYYFLRTVDASTLAHGGNMPSLPLSRINQILTPLPPLNEQRRIVEKIETLFARLDKGEEALREVQKLLARYRQSVLKAAVTGQLTGSDPETWKPVTLGTLLEDIRYGTAKKCRPDAEGVAVLRIPNVANGEIDLQDLKYTQLDDPEVEKLGLKKGDLLIVRSNGSANLVGRGAVVNDDAVGLAFAGYLIRLRLDQKRLLPDFLQLVLSSPVIRARIERQARSTSGVHNINSGEVKSIAFELPPVDVQAKITEMVNEHMTKIGDLETWCQSELTRSAALRQSILKDAFAGRLVPQDPNDLPAPRPGKWFVYVLECEDGSLYKGHSRDVLERWKQHATGRGAEWTAKHPPKRLVHWEELDSEEAAVAREKELKTGYGRKWLEREIKAGRTRQAGEPASVLLARIRAERAREPKKRKIPKTTVA